MTATHKDDESCRSMNRNFCAGNGKRAALFIDIDGTISVCQRYFDEACADFIYYMTLRGFHIENVRERLRALDHQYMLQFGYERARFSKTLVDCYLNMCKEKKRRFSKPAMERDVRFCEHFSRAPFFRDPEIFPNAAPVLGRAHHSFLIIAVSLGNREAQKFKVHAGGLAPVFDELIFTSSDNKAELVVQAIQDYNIDPSMSAMIGNSRRSDGACLLHTNFIYMPLEAAAGDDGSLPISSGFELYEAKDWREAETEGINRLLRKRKAAAFYSEEAE